VSEPLLSKLVVIGVGLIGGSFALALRQAQAVQQVVGVGRTSANLDVARRAGIADRTYTLDQKWTVELRDADLVMLATPVGQMPSLFERIAPHVGGKTVLTDAGSTKRDVIAAARLHLGASLPRFVAGHPIAGTEHSGAAAAFDSLFRDKAVVLTPIESTDAVAVDRVSAAWTQCGAAVSMLDAERHDAVFAAVSHLPHALAFALVAELSERADAAEYFRYAASGFRDFTRLASSDPEMWRDICIANAAALRRELSVFREQLGHLESLLEASDGGALAALFAKARQARNAWLASRDRGTEV
jgi:prephenate dehydrogenase